MKRIFGICDEFIWMFCMKRDGWALEFWMSPNGHGMSIGLWIISGVLTLRFGHGHGHMDMDWETIAPQHESSCFAWSLEFVFGIMLRSIALYEATRLYS
jgi:hypothetical protein